jgi:hypothetical protein
MCRLLYMATMLFMLPSSNICRRLMLSASGVSRRRTGWRVASPDERTLKEDAFQPFVEM